MCTHPQKIKQVYICTVCITHLCIDFIRLYYHYSSIAFWCTSRDSLFHIFLMYQEMHLYTDIRESLNKLKAIQGRNWFLSSSAILR